MSRQYPSSYDDASPLTPSSANPNAPISYSANVNRQKTKKWIEAKPADYGGGWGDEYDEDEEEPETRPVPPKATGLRQSGQAIQPPASGSSTDSVKKPYGDLPAVQTDSQPRSATTSARTRINSFGQDDERRAFSATTPRSFDQMLPSTNPVSESQPFHPPSLQIATNPSVTGLRKPNQQTSPVNTQASQPAGRDEPQSTTSSRYTDVSKQSEMRSPASDFQPRRDFSPSAVSHPAQPRYSPASQSAASDAPSTRFPPRKSSMSSNPPDLADITRTSQEQKPWVAPRAASPSDSARSPTSDKKNLPFIRPADIYKRMEEERERERQSMDSSRPSMDSIVGTKAGDRSASPARGTLQGLRSESPGAGYSKIIGLDTEHGSDSGRRAVLEPVRERRSEYGLEGFEPPPESAATNSVPTPAINSEPHHDEEDKDEVESHRYSTSPKLPDLGRMSGFGMDMFSQPIGDRTFASAPAPTSVSRTVPSASTAPDDTHLRPQPSLGFNSVVSQAFNQEIPGTPTSATGSGVKRTDSESTGTTGISPIISRVSSTGVARNSDERQTSTTHAIEEVDEPLSRHTSSHGLQSFGSSNQAVERVDTRNDDYPITATLPETHRNINAPNAGNNAARTPFVEIGPNRNYHLGEEAHILQATQQSLNPIDTIPHGSRPHHEREQSFRPAIPGNWVSYATTASNNNAQLESEAQASDAGVSPISDEEDDVEIPPTTKGILSQSAPGTVAAAALRSSARTESPPLTPIESSGVKYFPPTVQSNSQLPTPDPALAPSGNPYAASALDPRLQQSSGALSVPRQVTGDFASASSAPPTPPPKDTPGEEVQPQNPEYFPPHVPLKPKTQDEVAANERFAPPMRPQVLPTLSTATSPQDEESDKLRKEIVKSLSPRSSDAGPGHSLPPFEDEGAATGTRESTYLPSEYDNYWASTDDGEVGQHPMRDPSSASRPEQDQFVGQPNPEVSPDAGATPPIPPLSSKRRSIDQHRPDVGNRFSWEAGSEQVMSPVPAPLNISRPVTEQGATPDSQLRQLDQTREAYFEDATIDSSTRTPAQETPFANPSESPLTNSGTGPKNYNSVSEPLPADSGHGKDAAFMTGGLAAGAAVGAAFAAHQTHRNEPQRRLSLAEEKSPANASSYAVSQTPPEDEHPSLSPQPLVSPVSLGPGSPLGQSRGVAQTPSSTGLNAAGAPKIKQFKEIFNIQNQENRVQAYVETRNQFLNMDTGLSGWLASIGEQHHQMGEHSYAGGPARPSAHKATGSSPSSPALQQPYYQQYLNASPTTSRPTTAGPAAGFPSGTQQGLSPGPGASKLSGQQVQAKSKDLLHSAGVFGGKASKAGKGLFAKGKNKLKGSGGGDKDSPPLKPSPPPTKPKLKDGRRSSWGISNLSLPRSSARNDASSQHSREQTPTHHPPHGRTASFPLQLETTPTPPVSQREISLRDAPVSAVSIPSVGHSGPVPTPQPLGSPTLHPQAVTPSGYAHSNGEVSRDGDESEEERDGLGVPAPIGKNQPSWDPFNATPIVEEEGFQYEDRLKPNAARTAVPQLDVPGLHRPLDSASDRSDSGETAYLSARERHSETTERPSDDWVLVSKEESPHVAGEPNARSGLSVPVIAPGVDIDNVAPPARNAAPPALVSESFQTPPPPAAREAVVQVQEIETPSGEFPPSRGPATREQIPTKPVPQSQNRQGQYASTRGITQQQANVQPRGDVEEYAPPPGPPPQQMASRRAEPLDASQYRASAPPVQTSPKPIYEQSKQERYSQSPAFSPPRPSNSEQAITTQPAKHQTVPLPLYNPITTTGDQQLVPKAEDSSKSGWLPPIRRTSTFGLGFGKGDKRTPLEDGENTPPVPAGPKTELRTQPAPAGNNRFSWTEEDRPAPIHQSSSNYDQSIAGSDAPTLSSKDAPPQQAQHIPSAQPSQEGWRPNAPSSTPNQRSSMEAQRMRSGSASNNGYMITPGTAGVPMQRPPSFQQQRQFEQPPSSAQRYPELFRPEKLGEKPPVYDGDLPAEHYQAALSREEVFLPRHQTNEYQLPGVGPPPDEPPNGRTSRRNSALFKELGGRLSRELSRATSRDRSTNRDLDVDDDDDLPQPKRILASRDTGISEPSIASFDTTGEKKKRRSSFFGAISRASTSTPNPPQSRESMVAHAPGSRTDLVAGVSAQPSPLGPQDKKRSFFGGGGGASKSTMEPNTTPNKLSRASTTGLPSSEQPGKKKRFSGLSSIFGSSGKPGGEQERRMPASPNQVMQGQQNSQGYQQQGQVGHFHQAGQPVNILRGPPGGPALEGRQLLQSQTPQGGPQAQGRYLESQNIQDQQLRGQAPQLGHIPSTSPFQFTQDPTNLMRQGPRGPVPPAGSPPDRNSPSSQQNESEKKPGGAPPMYQPTPQQPNVIRHQSLSSGQEKQLPNQAVPGAQTTPRKSPPSQQVPPSVQPRAPASSVVAQPPHQQGPQNFQRQTSQNSQPFAQGLQDSRINHTQGSAFPQNQDRQQPMGPVNNGQKPGPISDYPRQNHGGQPSLPPAQTELPPPSQRQSSSEQIPRQIVTSPQVAGGPRRSSSAQRKLTRPSPTQQEKSKEKGSGSDSGGNRSSASRLFGGLLGKVSSSDKANKEPLRNGPEAQSYQRSSQPWPNQELPPAIYQQHPQPAQQPQAQPSQGNVQTGPQYRFAPQQIPMRYQDPKHPQDRGRVLQREPQYDQPPIPGAYSLVRGEGVMLAPTNYDPRGVNRQYAGPPANGSRVMYQNVSQQHTYQMRHASMQQQQGYPPQAQQQQGYPQQAQQQQGSPPLTQQNQVGTAPQFVTQHPNLSSQAQESSQSPPNDYPRPGRPLSSEDLLARSPARPQFGQQAPYQLTLPEQKDGDDTEEEALLPPTNKENLSQPAREAPHVVVANSENVKTPTISPPPKNRTAAGTINTAVQKLSQPSLQHPLSPATYPLPKDSVFSPINPSAQEFPPPPPPKNWPQTQNARAVEPEQGLDRSNTNNTHASEISQLSGPKNTLSVPTVQEPRLQSDSHTPPSPQITPQVTPERSPEMVQPKHVPESQEEDLYSASPPPRAAARSDAAAGTKIDTSVGGNTKAGSRLSEGTRPGSSSAHEKQLAGSPDQRARRRTEQEEKILVNEGGLHATTGVGGESSVEEEESAMMSATSYPGQEWNPYGNGVFEDWD